MQLVVKNRPGTRTTGTLMERRRTFAYGARRLSATPVVETVGPTVGEIDLDRYILRSLSSLLPPCHTIDPMSQAPSLPLEQASTANSSVQPSVKSISTVTFCARSVLCCRRVIQMTPTPPSFEPSYLSTAETSAVATFEISVESAVW